MPQHLACQLIALSCSEQREHGLNNMLVLMDSPNTQFQVKLRQQEKGSSLIQAPSTQGSQFEKASTVYGVILDTTLDASSK